MPPAAVSAPAEPITAGPVATAPAEAVHSGVVEEPRVEGPALATPVAQTQTEIDMPFRRTLSAQIRADDKARVARLARSQEHQAQIKPKKGFSR